MVKELTIKWIRELFRVREKLASAQDMLKTQERLKVPTQDTKSLIRELEDAHDLLEEVVEDFVHLTGASEAGKI